MIHVPTLAGTSEIVVFEWSTEHGECYDCGCPAAYTTDPITKLCAVCAAQHAADGETIVWLFAESEA